MRRATDAEIAEIEAGLDGLPGGPWDYRPRPFDDWGMVRVGGGAVVANARAGSLEAETQAEFTRHREEGTDPYQAVGMHIARCSPDAIRALIARAKAAPAEDSA